MLIKKPYFSYPASKKVLQNSIYAYELDDALEAFSLSALTINAFWPPNHKKCFGFALLCLWNVQIQILNQPKRPS